ncbi:hypothetical protein T06_4091 [Trichinella sp. T6]|nr:hypothetical protein T06_4091 [Trichinella sp. T6]
MEISQIKIAVSIIFVCILLNIINFYFLYIREHQFI